MQNCVHRSCQLQFQEIISLQRKAEFYCDHGYLGVCIFSLIFYYLIKWCHQSRLVSPRELIMHKQLQSSILLYNTEPRIFTVYFAHTYCRLPRDSWTANCKWFHRPPFCTPSLCKGGMLNKVWEFAAPL